MLIRGRPASLSAWACSASRMPLVVRAMSSNAVDRRQPLDELWQIGPHQRLAAGQPQLVDAQRGRHADEPLDLLEREDLAPRHEPHVLVRHAIEAADIAAVGDADPQVRVNAAERVDKWSIWDMNQCKSICH